MSCTTLSGDAIGVDEYLSTTYHPDCDFVDGELKERNSGTKDRSGLQSAFIVWFHERRH